MTDFGGKTSIFSHPVYLFLRKFSLQDSRGGSVCADFEAELVEMDGEPDHVHLLINYPPKLAISSLVNS
ncbi:transposase, partial [Escherichia coli]|uniref:transposase n=1 Tax=Escherichia coli TaxID=562 RepID=UPI003A4DAC2E